MTPANRRHTDKPHVRRQRLSLWAAGAALPPGPVIAGPAQQTGANRLLIGVGWSMVVFLAWYQWRRKKPSPEVSLEPTRSVEISFLAVASLYSVSLRFKRTITLLDSAFLVALFVAYAERISKAPPEEPDLVGPAACMGASRPGDDARFGVTEFLLVQWLAPLASEAPVYLVITALPLVGKRRRVPVLFRKGLRTPYAVLAEQR